MSLAQTSKKLPNREAW